jgi:hypothetical protein
LSGLVDSCHYDITELRLYIPSVSQIVDDVDGLQGRVQLGPVLGIIGTNLLDYLLFLWAEASLHSVR